MKKLLLSLCTVFAATFALSAEEYTITFKANAESNNQGPEIKAETALSDVIESGAEYVASLADLDQAYAACNFGLKIGANKKAGAITLNLSDLGIINATKIEVYASASKNPTYQKLSVNGTNFDFTTADVTSSFKVCTIEPNTEISSIKLEKTNASSTSNQQGFIFINKIVVTSGESNPNAPKPAGLAWSAASVDVDVDLIEEFVAPTLTNPNNLTVKYSSSNETVAVVNETTGVVALEGEEGTTIISAIFDGNDSFKAQTVSYTINVKAKAAAVNTVAATIALADGTPFTVGYELTVGYAFNKNVFACDAAGDFIQIYAPNSYKAGDKIPAGWEGTYKLYQGVTPEIEASTVPAATAGTFTPKTVAAADINNSLVNSVITIKDVVFAEATPSTKDNFTGTVGDVTLSLRNNYTIKGVEAGTYDVTVVVTLFKATGATEYTPSLYVVEYKTQGGTTPEPVEDKVTTLAEAFALATNSEVTVDMPLTVAFINGGNIFVCDQAGDFIQIYDSTKESGYKVGDVLAKGWKAKYTVRYDVPQFTAVAALPAVESTTTFTPATVAAADVTKALVNHVIVVKNVVLADASPATKENFTGTVGDVTLSLRNNYALPSVDAGTYDITLWVNLYNGELSLYVIDFAKSQSVGIDEIEAADDAEAVYYNLQGVRVDNPENGIFIRVRGSKVDKVIK